MRSSRPVRANSSIRSLPFIATNRRPAFQTRPSGRNTAPGRMFERIGRMPWPRACRRPMYTPAGEKRAIRELRASATHRLPAGSRLSPVGDL
jgi:hypothetical protein